MFLPLVQFAAVDLQADAQVAFRTRDIDAPNNQRFRIEIQDDFRLVWSDAARG